MNDDVFYIEEPEEETVFLETEPSEFERELPNYLPTPENTDKLRKKMPAWLISVITSAVTAIVLFAVMAMILFPNLKPAAVINYVEKYKHEAETEMSGGISGIYENMSKSIVSIKTKTAYQNFFGISESQDTGSGVILTENGYILTSNSLVANSSDIKIIIGAEELAASLIGTDINKDIAILKVEKEGLSSATLADSSDVKPGDVAIVMGNVIGEGLGTSITRGVISGVNNNVPLKNGTTINLLQTDAVTNSNNAGGCILNENGDIIGMITYAVSSAAENISFAIPSTDIKYAVDKIIGVGKEDVKPSGLIIGFSGSDTEHGVVVESVLDDTPAKASGIKSGDLILKVDGTAVKSVEEVNKIRDTHKKGDIIKLTVYRDGEITDINVTL